MFSRSNKIQHANLQLPPEFERINIVLSGQSYTSRKMLLPVIATAAYVTIVRYMNADTKAPEDQLCTNGS